VVAKFGFVLCTVCLFFSTGTLAITCLMVGNAQSEYIHANPSLCEGHDENGSRFELDLAECPAALDVVFTITFVTGLIMVRKQLTRVDLNLCKEQIKQKFTYVVHCPSCTFNFYLAVAIQWTELLD